MSKIGGVNLDLQEQANELGFSTVQEALDNGYRVIFNKYDEFKLVSDADYEHEEAHKAWLAEREILLYELRMLVKTYTTDIVVCRVANDAIEFIEKGEV